MLVTISGLRTATIAALVAMAAGCSPAKTSNAAADYERALLMQLETAAPGAVITIPPGIHPISQGLVLNANGVTIRGAGMDKSVLSFREQVAGAEGLLVNASDFTIEDVALEDAKGDALKINEGKNIAIRRVRTEWTGGPKTTNGAYGIYPLQTENTLIDGAVAIGATAAGIHVGQSRNIVVQNSRAEFNVAGIEIENTIGADVHDNLATNNTGGILIFNMPDLPQAGHTTRVFNNKVVGNNTPNFSAEGSAVASVPAGAGVVINSNDQVEVFNNEIGQNNTANLLISSYFSVTYSGDRQQAASFDAYPEGIFVFGNTFSAGGAAPAQDTLQRVRHQMFGDVGNLPDIVWDGRVDTAKFVEGRLPDALSICIDNGTSEIVNTDSANDFANPKIETDAHRCSIERLPAITLPDVLTAL